MGTLTPARARRWLAGLAAACLAVTFATPSRALAASYTPIKGSGSSWAGTAIDAWATDVHPQGIVVNFTASGSAAGRADYIKNQADFAASDIAFLTTPDPFGGGIETSSYAYSYVPIVAGGTAFMYNLKIGNRKVTNLRLTGDTLAKIFTGQITNWSDPAITKDYGQPLPSQKITVVTRSDGSGATYQFTRWMSKQYSSQWNAFCGQFNVKSPCPATEFYPKFGSSVQRNGSDQVADYVASSTYGVGSIGYDEYSYALGNTIPAVKVLNAAGYYTLPSASNVAIALQKAEIDDNPNSLTFLIQNLDHVYTYTDRRAYPLSSYSYLIVPRNSRQDSRGVTLNPPPGFSGAKGKTLTTWMNYLLCGAQQSAGRLGYSPLPKNLVVGGFEQEAQIPGHVAIPDTTKLKGCNNPTYSDGVNHLIKDAPMPSPCDYKTAPLNCTVSNGKAAAGVGPAGGATAGNGGTPAGVGGVTAGGAVAAGGAAAGGSKIDPETGQLIGTAGGGGGTGSDVYAVPVAVTGRQTNAVLGVLTAVELLALVVIPAVLVARRRRRLDRP